MIARCPKVKVLDFKKVKETVSSHTLTPYAGAVGADSGVPGAGAGCGVCVWDGEPRHRPPSPSEAPGGLPAVLVDSLASGGARPQERAEAAKLYGSEAAAAKAGAAATFEPDEELAEVGEGLRVH